LAATGTGGSPTNLSGSTPVSSGASFKADTYSLSESGGPAGYTNTHLTCDDNPGVEVASVTVDLGDSITCTFVNDDVAAGPSGATVQHWVLQDTLMISGIRPGAPDAADANVDFYLYSDVECLDIVDSEVDLPIDSNGVVATADGISVGETGIYYWIASYSGDQFNDGFDTACGDEITELRAKDAFGDGRDDLLELLGALLQSIF